MGDPIGKIFGFLFLLVKLFWQGMINALRGIIAWFSIESNLFLVKTFSLFLSLILLVIILILVKKTGYWTDIIWDDLKTYWLKGEKVAKKKIEWKKIGRLAEVEDEAHLKLAVIEADKLLDSTLREMGYEEEGLFKKLEGIEPGIISNINDLKKAHSFRNKLIHEPDFKPSLSEIRAILAIYEQTFRELGYL